MINSIGVTVRFGKRVLFEDVNIKFTKGNCYGLIGANGAGKSTFLKVLSGELEPSKGEIAIDKGARLSVLKQNHFEYEEFSVIDTVIMGNKRLYDIMKEKEALYMKPDFNEEDGLKAAKLEEEFGNMDGWNAEADAAILLNNLGIPAINHYKLMKELEAKDKVKVLLAQSLFGNPDVLLLDEPTNGLDPEGIKQIKDLIVKLAKEEKMAVLISSHNLLELESFCTKITILKNGEVIENTSIDEVKQDENTSYIFEVENEENAIEILKEKAKRKDKNTIEVKVNKEDVPEIIEKLVKNNIKIYSVYQKESNLEDAFLKKIGGNVID